MSGNMNMQAARQQQGGNGHRTCPSKRPRLLGDQLFQVASQDGTNSGTKILINPFVPGCENAIRISSFCGVTIGRAGLRQIGMFREATGKIQGYSGNAHTTKIRRRKRFAAGPKRAARRRNPPEIGKRGCGRGKGG